MSLLHFLAPSHPSFLPFFPLKTFRSSLPVFSCSSPKTAPSTEQEVLKAIAESDGKTLPCVRTFENDLSRLSLVGAVDFEQALTAAAADGGEAANEHIESGVPAMVVETVFPGPGDEHSTISTRLFLPARKVKEKATKLRRSFAEDNFPSSGSKNILAMTFRQVVLQHLWNFELVLFGPGTKRNMGDLESEREVSSSFTLSSSNERAISLLAEVICISSLQSVERHFLDNFLGTSSTNRFYWFHKPTKFTSRDSSVIMYRIFEDELIENAKILLKTFKSAKGNTKPVKSILRNQWWTTSAQSKLQKIGGPEFSAWATEYVPAYKLEIDVDRLKGVSVEGWKQSAENKWEILLTHSQLVDLASILDMYYEDSYSIPNKRLPCNEVSNYAKLLSKKRNSSLFKILSAILASGTFLVAVSALGQICLPYLARSAKNAGETRSLPSAEIDYEPHQSVDSEKLEAFCILVIQKIKNGFGWLEDITTETNIGAWSGQLPAYLRNVGEADSRGEALRTPVLEPTDAHAKKFGQEIASYQVVLSADGKIIGFQPMSRVAVNHWASNPLAKELYGTKKFSPGLIEPSLKIEVPDEVIVIELLVSINPDVHFALARPFRNVI